jgi:hypothetical protein
VHALLQNRQDATTIGVCVGWVKGENSREKAKVAMGIARYEIRQPKKGTAAD